MNQRNLLTTTGLVAMVLVPLTFLIWLRVATDDRLSELELRPTPLTAVANVVSIDDSEPAVATAAKKEGRALSSLGLVGTITGIHFEEGGTLSDGASVLEVDLVPRLGYVSEFPFHRSLSVGDRGRDVAALGDLLVRWELLEEFTGDSYDSRIRAGVRALAGRIGVVSDGRVLDRAWLVWLGPNPFRIAMTAVSVGDVLNGLDELATGVEEVTNVTFSSAFGGSLELSGRRLFEATDFTIALTDGAVAESDLLLFEGAPEEGLTGSIRLAEPRAGAMVAATAVQLSSNGSACVWVQYGSNFVDAAVVVHGGRASLSEVEGLDDGAVVLINPAAVLDDASCP